MGDLPYMHVQKFCPQSKAVRIWLWRVGANLRHFGHKDLQPVQLAENICIALDLEKKAMPPDQLQAYCRKKLKDWDGQFSDNSAVWANVSMLAVLLKLNALETELLLFGVLIREFEDFMEFVDQINTPNYRMVIRALGIIVDESIFDVDVAVSPNGRLERAGLLSHDRFTGDLSCTFEISPKVLHAITQPCDHEEELVRRFVTKAAPAKLGIADFAYLGEELLILKLYLTETIKRGSTGVNVLLYGPPGTGKSELSRTIAAHINSELFEVRATQEDGEPAALKQRLAAYQLSQIILVGLPNRLIVFDEVEDVFPTFFIDQSFYSKAWMNSLLETNAVPTIWICNEIRQIDKAYLRRFDFAIELKVPNKDKRRELVQAQLGEFIESAGLLEALASNSQIAPAQISKARKVAETIDGGLDKECIFRAVIAASHSLETGRALTRLSATPDTFSIEFINANTDISVLVRNLEKTAKAGILLYGPPGTGKTSFAKHLAVELRRPLHSHRASTLLSRYLGETEANIASIFRQANDDGAVLFLDEVDSYLQPREHAVRTWEVTQVNELLTQIDDFTGIFVCATNMLDRLDEAAMRRLGVKIEFGFLTASQRVQYFQKRFGFEDADLIDETRDALRALAHLTPGDMEAVGKKSALLGISGQPGRLIESLREELQLKKVCRTNRIGFV